jgi:putative heme transporter
MNIENKPIPFSESISFKASIYMLWAVLALVILVVGKPFLVPLAWSIIIAFASIRMLNKVEARLKINRSLIIIAFIIVVLTVIILILYFFYIEIREIMLFMPELSETLTGKSHDLVMSLKGIGVAVPEHIDKQYFTELMGSHSEIIIGFLSEFGKNIGNIFLIGFYLFFILNFRDVVRKFIKMRFKNKERINEITEELKASFVIVNSYIYGLILLTFLTIVMNYVVFLLFGMQYALFFAVLVGLLNILPYIGNPIAMVMVLLFSIVTMESLTIPILIQVGLFITNFIQDNILKPWLLGDKLHVNAFVIFLSVVVGGYVWGFSGMLLFIPIVGITKILLERNESTKPYAVFFSGLTTGEEKQIDQQVIDELIQENSANRPESN